MAKLDDEGGMWAISYWLQCKCDSNAHNKYLSSVLFEIEMESCRRTKER